ncbi:MAG: hypothetical protein P8076_02755 [Gammaproteobacteria bacterium]
MTDNDTSQTSLALDAATTDSFSEMIDLLSAAKDATSDEMIERLSSALSEGMALLDRLNRSGIDRGLPVLAQMVSGDELPRMLELMRLMASVQDSLSDDIVARLSTTISEGLDLLDRVNRSGVGHALPAIRKLVENGDLDRMVNVAGVLSSAVDALSEDIISRLAVVFSEGIALVDRLARNEGVLRILGVLEHSESRAIVIALADALVAAGQDLAQASPAKGGATGLWGVAKQPGTQEGLHWISLIGEHLGRRLRAQQSV